MKNTFFIIFLLLSTTSYSQTIRANILSVFPLHFSGDSLIIDSSRNILKSKNPVVIITENKMELRDADTTVIYFNEPPEVRDNEKSFDRIWSEAEDQNGRACLVLLFYFKEEKGYQLRVFFIDTISGYEMFLYPI